MLLQLSPYFKYDSPPLNALTGLLDSVSADKCDYAVEFRHQSWLDESKKELDPEVLEILRAKNVANVLIDGPGLHFGSELTANHAYLHFHGPNYDI